MKIASLRDGSCTYFASADHGAVEIIKKPPSEREGDHGVVEGACVT